MRIRSVLMGFAVALISGLTAQTQLTDLFFAPGDNHANPAYFLPFKDLLLFTAKTESEGIELWVKNGNETYLLKDLSPGTGHSILPDLRDISVLLDGKLFFMANDGENGIQLWSTDGTTAGTQKITEIAGLDTKKLILVGNQIFFLVKTGERLHLWKSDGTAAGTQLVKGEMPNWNDPLYQGNTSQLFFFSFQPEGSNNARLWRSDGTEAGTFPLTENENGNGAGPNVSVSFNRFFTFDDELYFIAQSNQLFPYGSTGLMKTDGTMENTVAVAGLYDDNFYSTSYIDGVQLNGKLYLYFYSFDLNAQWIWESDGTENGTQLIFDQSGGNYFIPSRLLIAEDKLFFTTVNFLGYTTLLSFDPNSNQTEEIKQLTGITDQPFAFYEDVNLATFHPLGNNLYYLVIPHNYTAEGWITDLTESNTSLLPTMNNVRFLTPYEDKMYFSRYTLDTGLELWQTDLTFSEPELSVNINTSKFGLISDRYIPLDNRIFFVHNTETAGRELWAYDTLTAQAAMISDIYPGAAPSLPMELTALGNYLYFSANSETYGRELWRSDGTTAGTKMVSDFTPGMGSSFPEHLFVFQNQLYFTVNQEGRFFIARLQDAGIEIVKDLGFNEYNQPFSLREVAVAKAYFYFVLEAEGGDLWRSDGTTAGTIKLKDLYSIQQVAVAGEKVFFTGPEVYQGEQELWVSDGSIANTRMVMDIGSGYSSNPGNFIAFREQLVFTAYTRESGREYWISDGTTAGSRQLADINPGSANGAPLVAASTFYQAAELNGWLYFAAQDGSQGMELWKTDGTASGTSSVKDINVGATGSLPQNLISHGSRIYFTAYTPDNGVELWTTQGGESSTALLFDLIDGSSGSAPTHLSFLGNELFFVAATPASGRQLWRSNIEDITKVKEYVQGEALLLYPNPTVEYLFFKNPGQALPCFSIFSINGRHIRMSIPQDNAIYVGDLPAGMYLVVGRTGNRLMSQRFVKSGG